MQHIEIRVHELWCERKLRKIIRASQQCWKIHDTWHEMLRMHMFIFRQNIKHYLYSFVEWYVRVIVIDTITSCHFWLNDYLFWSERHDVTKIFFLMISFGNNHRWMPQLQIFLNLNVLYFDTTQCKTNHKNSLKRHILDNTLSWKNEKTDVKVDICSVT